MAASASTAGSRTAASEKSLIHIAAEKARGDAIGRGEFPGITVGRTLLGLKRLPQPMHRALADLADHFDYVVGLEARAEPPRAVDIRMRHGSARIGLERERLRHPARAEVADQRVVIALGRAREAVKEAVHAFEHGARPGKPARPRRAAERPIAPPNRHAAAWSRRPRPGIR